tara:strand:+ start:419 stop:799 length:381 start_codon:yes stop_codon:yes gene_type:complete
MIIEEIPFFTEFVIMGLVLGFGYGFTKLFLNHLKDKTKIRRRDQQKSEKESGLENEIDSYLDNVGTIGNKIEQEIKFLKEKGATPDQLKSLESKLDMANKVQQYEPIIRLGKKPVLKVLMRFLDKV